jgi:hypothetical protein
VGEAQKATTQRIIEVLEAKARPFLPEEIEKAIEERDLRGEGSPNQLAQEVLAEGARRGVEVLKGFSDAFQVPLPLLEAEKVLREGGVVLLERDGSRNKEPSLKVEFRKVDGSQLGRAIKTLHLPLHGPELPRDTELYVWPGLSYLRLGYSSLAAVRGRAFFMGLSEEEVEGTAEDVRALAPFLPVMDLDGLVEAFDSLMELKKDEAKVEGPHILARGERFWALRRGAILGDPEVDKALLAEREVSLSFPGDVEIVLRVKWTWEWEGVGFHDLRVRWGEEVAHFGEGIDEEDQMLANPLDRNPLAEAVRNRLRREVDFFESEGWSPALDDLSPRTQAFVRVLAEQEDPLAFLAEGRLSPHVTAELFRDL